MAVFKCKMCGGDLDVADNQTTAECRYCGTMQTLPRLDNDRRANLYDRANHFRRNNEFDKAAGIYEQVLTEDPDDAEAYWCRVLCRYGIEYVEDPATHKRVPTVNRAQYTSIYDDEDYKQALAKGDGAQQALYKEEAAAINEIQKGILEISAKEEPFDVFICYKETDATGRRTQDSVLANDLYHQLTQEGFKVFFARITLEDKLGSAYEPYIFAALNSAKVMVVLGTRPEYFKAVWVRNEWSRYLGLIKAGAKKTLIPAYRDMDPYDLPDEFSHLQAQDMSKLGFMQDLIRGIKKIAAPEEKMPATVVVQGGSGGDVAALLKRAFMFLEDGEWQQARDYCERVLDIDPENAEAYLGELMADIHVRRRSGLRDAAEPFDGRDKCVKAARFGDAALKEELSAANEHIRQRNETARLDGLYQKAAAAMAAANSEPSYLAAAELFDDIAQHKDAQSQAKVCREKAEECAEAAAKKKRLAIIGGAFVAVIIVVVLVVTQVVMPAQTRAKFEAAGFEGVLGVGDVVQLGSYEQDGNTANGKESIEWRVLAIESSKVLLVSECGLDVKPFNANRSKGNDWNTSDLKKWLDGDFKKAAGLDNVSGELTCLSVEEAIKYFKSGSDRVCKPTKYATKQGAYEGFGGPHRWWLRSPGRFSDLAAYVDTDGSVDTYGFTVDRTGYAVRPALWVNL